MAIPCQGQFLLQKLFSLAEAHLSDSKFEKNEQKLQKKNGKNDIPQKIVELIHRHSLYPFFGPHACA